MIYLKNLNKESLINICKRYMFYSLVKKSSFTRYYFAFTKILIYTINVDEVCEKLHKFIKYSEILKKKHYKIIHVTRFSAFEIIVAPLRMTAELFSAAADEMAKIAREPIIIHDPVGLFNLSDGQIISELSLENLACFHKINSIESVVYSVGLGIMVKIDKKMGKETLFISKNIKLIDASERFDELTKKYKTCKHPENFGLYRLGKTKKLNCFKCAVKFIRLYQHKKIYCLKSPEEEDIDNASSLRAILNQEILDPADEYTFVRVVP